MTTEDRKIILNDINDQLQNSNYRYVLQNGSYNGPLPPPAGTALNCRAVAQVFMDLAAENGVGDLECLYFSFDAARGGYLVLINGDRKALGDEPILNSGIYRGYEFSNHYRVRDKTTRVIYDPTFGTSSDRGRGNIPGYRASSFVVGKNFSSVTVYGERYKVVRKGPVVTCDEITHKLVLPQYVISDQDFQPNANVKQRVMVKVVA